MRRFLDIGENEMKEYSDEHLESVPPEYIWAVEKSIEMLEYDNYGTDFDTCMVSILESLFDNIESEYFDDDCYDRKSWCPKFLDYTTLPPEIICPCYKFGTVGSIAMMKNLVKQWKAWAGLVG